MSKAKLVNNIREAVVHSIDEGIVDKEHLLLCLILGISKQELFDILDANEYFHITRPDG